MVASIESNLSNTYYSDFNPKYHTLRKEQTLPKLQRSQKTSSQRESEATFFLSKLSFQVSKIAQEILNSNPEFLGTYNLFRYDKVLGHITLDQPLKKLISLLVEMKRIDPRTLKVNSIEELNTIFQRPQDDKGLMRKAGVERWLVEDTPVQKKYLQEFEELLEKLGFNSSQSINEAKVDHCIIFGADPETMSMRITETIKRLENLEVKGEIFLLACDRKLGEEEIKQLQKKIELLPTEEQKNWFKVFDLTSDLTEADVINNLWLCLAPENLQKRLQDKITIINSTKIGECYQNNKGYRSTTEVTIKDLKDRLPLDKSPTIMFSIEQCFVRLGDQLRFNLISNCKKASLNELQQKINMKFHCIIFKPDHHFNVPILLDECARNFYHGLKVLEYLNGLKE